MMSAMMATRRPSEPALSSSAISSANSSHAESVTTSAQDLASLREGRDTENGSRFARVASGRRQRTVSEGGSRRPSMPRLPIQTRTTKTNPMPASERAKFEVYSVVCGKVSNWTDAQFLEDMAREEDVVDNVLGNPITPLTDYEKEKLLPFVLDGEGRESVPPSSRAASTWIEGLLWFLSRHDQRNTRGFLREGGNVKKVKMIKEFVNYNFKRDLSEAKWASIWEHMLKHGVLSDPSDAKSARENVSVHDLMSTAKAYLLGMPDSLIPEHHRGLWTPIVKAVAEDRAPWTSQLSGPEEGASLLLLLMPAGRHFLLRIVLKFLTIILKKKGDGKQGLDERGILTCFVPCIYRTNGMEEIESGYQTVKMLADKFEEITKVPEHLVKILEPGYVDCSSDPVEEMTLPGKEAIDNHDKAIEELAEQVAKAIDEKTEQKADLDAKLAATPKRKLVSRKKIWDQKKATEKQIAQFQRTLEQITQGTPKCDFQRVIDANQGPPVGSRAPLGDTNSREAAIAPPPPSCELSPPKSSENRVPVSVSAAGGVMPKRAPIARPPAPNPPSTDATAAVAAPTVEATPGYPSGVLVRVTPSHTARLFGQISGGRETLV